MTDKKDNNVRPIFAGLKVDTGEKPEPIPEIVDYYKRCLADAESGELREVCSVVAYNNKDFIRAWLGESVDYHVMQNHLRVLEDDHFAVVTYPRTSGLFYADGDEDLE